MTDTENTNQVEETTILEEVETEESSESNIETSDEVEVSLEDQIQQKIQELEDLLNQEKDKALRAYAELENYKKRKNQEIDSFRLYANEKVILEFLPVLDNFERALESGKEDDAISDFGKGIQMILKQMQDALGRLNVEKIEALNQTFDPNFHQAVSQETVEGVDSNIVTKVMQNGFKLKDRVIRPSLVVVSN